MNLIDFLHSPVAHALGWTLLHAVWQGFALVLPIAVVLQLLRRRSSAVRYQVGTLTLLAQLLLSAATFVWYYKPLVSPIAPGTTATAIQLLPIRWQTIAQTLERQPLPWHQQMQLFLENHLSQFVLIYLIGVALFGLRLAGGWLYLQRLTKTAMQPPTTIWMNLTDRLRSAMAIKSIVQVRESARIAVPMVVGVLKPVLLLPIGLVTHLTTREIEAVLAHELAHIKRHDYAVNLLQSVVEVLYFFHPALWWLSARVREEREHCCDDLAVEACGGDGRILAQALARVEELRLTQVEATPALAMTFASNRQHLLHRVRRMLGVPTRPFISNGSLAGLTLTTILLMSVSVYAIQKQDKPKPRITQPQPTRRHKVDSHSEYGMAGNKKISYVIWKGQKLPATRVARLQRQLDQVMAGQLSLDTVPEADRDILLTIIEKNSSFDEGMGALANGLAHIDYDNIVASALKNVPLSPDGTVEGLAKVNYDSIIKKAMASIDTNIFFNDNGVTRSGNVDVVNRYHQQQMDSLSQLLAQRSQQVQAIQLQMEKLRFPIEEINRNIEVLDWRKDKLMEQRDALIEKHQRLLHNDGKLKLIQADVEKQLAALEPEIKKLEGSMEELNKQFEQSNAKQEEAKQPMDKLKRQMEQLDEQINKLSDEIGKHGDGLVRAMPEDRMIEYEYDLRHVRPTRVTRLARPPRPPRPAIAPNITHPPMPVAPLRGHVAPAIAPVPVVPPVAARPRPMPTPRPVTVPKPPKP